jgi:hypothetical protein
MDVKLMILAIAAMVIVSSGEALADSAPEPGANSPVGADPSIGDIIIGEVERRIVRDYYQRHYDEWEHENGGKKNNGKKNGKKDKGLPPGLAKRGELPPGLAKQLVRNGHLPPGLENRDLPSDLLSRLPRLDPAYRYVVVDDKVMLVRHATNAILDVLTVAAVDLLD